MLKNPKYVYGPSDRSVCASLNYGEFMIKKLLSHQGITAFTNGETGVSVTYDEILQDALNFAVSLARIGVRKGDVVALSSENRPEFWSTVIGTICAGAVITPFNIAYTKDELKHIMSIAKPTVIICSPYSYKTYSETYKSIPFLKTVIVYGEEPLGRTLLYKDLTKANTSNVNLPRNITFEEFQPVDVDGPNDVVLILYSSGTTGLPKGVMLTHQNLLTICSPYVTTPLLLGLSITPWFHAMGFVSVLIAFSKGGQFVFLPKFEITLYLQTIEKFKVQQISVVPAVLVALCKAKLPYDTSSLVVVYCGAAPLYEETAQAVKKRFPSVMAVLQGYGMTETTLTATLNFNPDKIGSVGSLVSHFVAKIVDPETKEVLGPNKPGEICLKGAMIMKGYVGKSRKDDFDEEGFFKTGDVGYYDDEGYFYIVDRLKELIKYKGYQVAPAEIEAVLLKHKSVKDAAVVGIPNHSAGEVPLAFVVLQPDAKLEVKELQDFIAERLSNPKHIRGGVRFIQEIPRNPSGKILRKDLRKIATAKKSKL